MLYPIKFTPIYKNILWGGRNIEKNFNRTLPEGTIAESWEICCRKDGMSIISNGSLKGKTLEEAINLYEEDLLGKNSYRTNLQTFPLLIKIIDANDKLSVQVHPSDGYAGLEVGESGKTEMWYIIDAKPNANLVYGLREGISKETFIQSIKDKDIKSTLNFVPVKPGDSLYIPSGTVHAILDGILIAEIQQNSNTTYRVYDWDRVDKTGSPRELHLDNALEVINFKNNYIPDTSVGENDYGKYTLRKLAKSSYFTVEEINIRDSYADSTDSSRFFIYMVLDGSGIISYSEGQVILHPGETILIPASLGQYHIEGHLKVLKVYI